MWTELSKRDILAKDTNIYNKIKDSYFQNNNISKNVKSIKFNLNQEYDGCDSFGPQSYLYYLWVSYYDKNNKEQNDIWHREDWLDDSEECFYKVDHNPYLLSNLMYSCARDKNNSIY